MSDVHDGQGGDGAAAEVVGLLRSLPRTKITPENITQHMIDRWYSEKGECLDEIRNLREQLAAATARAEKGKALHRDLARSTMRHMEKLGAERDKANLRAAKLRLVAASMLQTFVDDVHPGYAAKQSRAVPLEDFKRWRRVVRETSLAADTDDGSGWTAEENAEFEQRYGVKAAIRLRAANDRVWQIVQELRQAAADEGRDPHQDPMARRLSAALVGAEVDTSPRSLPSGPTTEYRYVLADGSESEFELHNEGPCGCRREERPVYVGDWRPAPHRQVNKTEDER